MIPACHSACKVSFIQHHPPLTPPGCYLDRYLAMDLPAPVRGD
ncbi:MAG: hypothetical protein M5U09_23010 [Gammaproteobacteria bacterium]|nr:hypothetical protein [Gammaproteobacteria bacterium]